MVDYVGKKSSRQQQRSSPSPVRRHHHKQTSKQQRSRSPNNHRSPSLSPPPPPPHRSNLDNESNAQNEPTRTLFVGNLERDITESKLKEIFGRYGTIDGSKKKSLSKIIYSIFCF